jgi:Ca2+-binding RTX toxin-like protein
MRRSPRLRPHLVLLPWLLLLAGVVLLVGSRPAAAAPQVPASGRLSVSSAEAQGDDDSFTLDISANGRLVLFTSRATNLVPGDTNEQADLFLRNVVTGTTERVNLADDESQVEASTGGGQMSDDGRYVVFFTSDPSLVAGDTLGHADVFLRDRVAGTTTRVSVSDGEAEADANSFSPGISGDGTRVAFASNAENLVTGDTNEVNDVFLRDLSAGTTQRVSISTTEGQSDFSSVGASLDQDGSIVVFQTAADDLIGVNDTNDQVDIYARNLTSGSTFRVSVGVGGVQADGPSFVGQVSDSGTEFAWESDAQNLVPDDGDGNRDVFFRSIGIGGTTERVTVDTGGGDSNGFNSGVELDGSGTRVGFDSHATDLVAADNDGATQSVFVRDVVNDVTRKVSVRSGTVLDDDSEIAQLADNGVAAFDSDATNLVPGDTNGVTDVFVAGEVCDGRVVNVDLNLGAAPTASADVILGTSGGDTVNGLGGADRFCGAGGNDVFSGGLGNDRAFGGQGNDVLKGQDGVDRLDGAAGSDRLLGGNQNDTLFGVAGNDVLEGGNGNDTLNGGANVDVCKGQAGAADRAAGCETKTGVP